MTVFSELTLLAIGMDNWTLRGAMDEEDLGLLYRADQLGKSFLSPSLDVMC
jgi:hypothetical protein